MIQVVKRVFEILSILSECESLPLREITKRVSLKKTTCHNILKSLADLEIVKSPRLGYYQLGEGLHCLTSVPVNDKLLNDLASIHVERLAKQTGETAILSVLHDFKVNILCEAEGDKEVVVRLGAHKQGSIYRWATGRILLAHESTPVIEKIIKELGNPTKKDWPEVESDLSMLLKELEQIKKMKILTRSASMKHVISTASPIRRKDGRVVAAVGVSIPGFRAHYRIEEVERKLLETANAIELELSVPF